MNYDFYLISDQVLGHLLFGEDSCKALMWVPTHGMQLRRIFNTETAWDP